MKICQLLTWPLDRHQNRKSYPDPDRNQNEPDSQHSYTGKEKSQRLDPVYKKRTDLENIERKKCTSTSSGEISLPPLLNLRAGMLKTCPSDIRIAEQQTGFLLHDGGQPTLIFPQMDIYEVSIYHLYCSPKANFSPF